MMQYNVLVTEHFFRPRNVAGGPCPDHRVGRAGSVERGTWMEFQLDIGAEGLVAGAQFRAYGCPHAIALASWLTEFLPGHVVAANFTLDRQRVVTALDLPIEKTHCVLVAEDAIRACARSNEVENVD